MFLLYFNWNHPTVNLNYLIVERISTNLRKTKNKLELSVNYYLKEGGCTLNYATILGYILESHLT